MSRYYTVSPPPVISETLDDEAIIMNLDSGAYYSLRHVGASVWTALQHAPSESELIEYVGRCYEGDPGEIARATRRLLEELVTEGLIRAEDRPTAPDNPLPGSASGASRPDFSAPVLEKFTDMADLLLLDPIHEVDDEAGWPHARQGERQGSGTPSENG